MASKSNFKGYELDDLSVVFDQISNPYDWKAPIAAVVELAKVPVAIAAIEFYTGTPVTVGMAEQESHYTVRSVGYRAGPCGDH